MDIETGKVRLTDLASCGGCAAKYSAARLEQLLQGFVPVEAENLLVGLAPADDAAVHRRDQCAERRVRDGRDAVARALDRRIPGGAADGDAGRDLRRRRPAGARG